MRDVNVETSSFLFQRKSVDTPYFWPVYSYLQHASEFADWRFGLASASPAAHYAVCCSSHGRGMFHVQI